MNVIYGMMIPNGVTSKIYNELKNTTEFIKKEYDLDISIKMPIGGKSIIGINYCSIDDYFHIDIEEMNKFTTNENIPKVFEKLAELILTKWLSLIKEATESLINDGKTESEIDEFMKDVNLPDSIGMSWYISK